jgi:hypothetical protein
LILYEFSFIPRGDSPGDSATDITYVVIKEPFLDKFCLFFFKIAYDLSDKGSNISKRTFKNSIF